MKASVARAAAEPLEDGRGESKPPRKIDKVLLHLRRHGPAHTLHQVLLATVNSLVGFKILRAVGVARVDPEFLKNSGRYPHRFLSEGALRELAGDPEIGLSKNFVEEALSKGDECYGIFDGATLVSYGWYSVKPTRIDPPELVLDFSKEYVYMYKGFTHPLYRGQRLHALGMTLALRHYLSRGYKGLVSYVESNNFDSLKSTLRMGYAGFGSVYLLKIFGRYFTHGSRGCKRFDFRVDNVPPRRTFHSVRLSASRNPRRTSSP